MGLAKFLEGFLHLQSFVYTALHDYHDGRIGDYETELFLLIFVNLILSAPLYKYKSPRRYANSPS